MLNASPVFATTSIARRRIPIRFGTSMVILARLFISLATAAEDVTSTPQAFDRTIRPLLSEYCLKCHSTEKHKGDLDLERFTSLSEVLRHPKVWQGVVEQLGTGEMPPKDKPQPSAEQRERLLTWAGAVVDDVARAR